MDDHDDEHDDDSHSRKDGEYPALGGYLKPPATRVEAHSIHGRVCLSVLATRPHLSSSTPYPLGSCQFLGMWLHVEKGNRFMR